ncbi:polyphosphate kinase 1 [Marinigracilibium pacificum]|uniref:Polyphosphate kinase n=1 Tax=Marinigracilibium pacificum TaxID=2729599 RepID=A0A848J3X4_9BACT|nr:polyphosphate kinase 1 [Marinigracilibium pacificum]NMM49230.1 polyphosphate kinase 1 [Marinigracilibium pacificum]
MATIHSKKIEELIQESKYISRDLSWLQFNYRVLDQARKTNRTLIDRLKFLAITSSNLDEFFMIRVGSLYNYIDFGKERIDYSGLSEYTFRDKLFDESHKFFNLQMSTYCKELTPLFKDYGLRIVKFSGLHKREKEKVSNYFKDTVFPMLTPMTYDGMHSFPILMNKVLVFGVVTQSSGNGIQMSKKNTARSKISFIQIPNNLPRFFEIRREREVVFIPIEEIVREHISWLFRNVEIISADLFRLTRNGDFTLEESDDIETNFLDELKSKLKTRQTGRVVRIEVESKYNKNLLRFLKKRWNLEDFNIFKAPVGGLIDFTSFWQLIKHTEFKHLLPKSPEPRDPINYNARNNEDLMEVLKEKDILLHHPYNSISPLIELLEKSAEDPQVLSIKMTIYRLAKDSRIVAALLKAAENGKNVAVLFEVKARFDEENNIKQANTLRKAGCYVIYGLSAVKTHTKLLNIVRQEGKKVTSYVHLASGNYNEDTATLYTDIGMLTTRSEYAHDVSEFFNVITGHSIPGGYETLLTAPRDMRHQLIELIRIEAKNAKEGKESGIVVKINSLQDDIIIDELYEASKAGVPIRLIVRGMCCLKPGVEGLSENIKVISIVGDYLEHSRIYYFHNQGDQKLYGGSADIMVRSLDRRLESLFLIKDPLIKKYLINVLYYNLLDNVNSYKMNSDGSYDMKNAAPEEEKINVHEAFYHLTEDKLEDIDLLSI